MLFDVDPVLLSPTAASDESNQTKDAKTTTDDNSDSRPDESIDNNNVEQ